MKTLLALTCSLLLSGGVLFAQDNGTNDDSTRYDDVAAHLGLSDSQLACLDANKDAFREAAWPTAEELRAAQRALRSAALDGEDTTALQAEVDALAAQLASLRTTYVASAGGCLDSAQQTQLGDLIAAETLVQEVRQGIGLLLLESTEERTSGFAGRQRQRRGRR